MIKKTLPFILGFIIIFSPPLTVLGAGLVPDCNKGPVKTIAAKTHMEGTKTIIDVPEKYEYANPCDFNQLLTIVNNVINFLLVKIVTPLFALILVYAGWLYLSDMGSAEHKTKAKKILVNALIGFVIALAAWLVVKTILTTLGFTGPMYLA
jgi:hypothetical protein